MSDISYGFCRPGSKPVICACTEASHPGAAVVLELLVLCRLCPIVLTTTSAFRECWGYNIIVLTKGETCLEGAQRFHPALGTHAC
jgi:hypothetical protein